MEAFEVTAPAVSNFMAEQLRFPSGPWAGFTARLLNSRNQGLIERAIELLEVQPGHRVLDIGFGGAMSLSLLVGLVSHGRVVGIDPSPDMVRRAGRVLDDELLSGRLALEVAGVEAIPCADQSIDRALTVQTVYFWDHIGAGLSEILRVLVPGGRLAVGMMDRQLQEECDFERRGYHVVGRNDLRRRMLDAGFDTVRINPGPPGGPLVLVGQRPGRSGTLSMDGRGA